MSILLICATMLPFTFISLTKNCFSSAMVFIVDEGILTKFETGTITSVFYIAYAIAQVVGGVVTDKWNPERFITIALVGAAISNAIIFFNQNYIVMILAWIFNGIIQFAMWPAVFKIASTHLAPSMRESGLFVVLFAHPIGLVLSYIVAAIVSSYWQLNFLISAVGLLIMAIFWEISFAAIKPYFVTRDIAKPETAVKTEKSEQSVSFLKIALSSGIVVVFMIALFRSAFDLGTKALAPTMINESYEEVSPVLATAMNIIILGSGLCGSFAAKLIYPRFIRNEAVVLLICFVVTLPLVCLTLLIGQIGYWFIVVLLALMVFFMNGASIFTSSYIAAKYAKWGKDATLAGIMNAAASLGIVIANMLFTAIADATGWAFTIIVWICIMVCTILMCLLFLPMWTKFCKKT